MILFFADGECESDAFVRHCYAHYADIVNAAGGSLPGSVGIVREEGKKPRFDCEDVHFSLSHSHGVIMLGIARTEIGVDIEMIRPVSESLLRLVGATNEKEFFLKWTERESWMKFTGAGLRDFRTPVPEDAHFEHFEPFEGYEACVCAERQSVRAFLIDLASVEGRDADKTDKKRV